MVNNILFRAIVIASIIGLISQYEVSSFDVRLNFYKNANTYYWLGIADKGDLKSFKKSIYYLNQAESALFEMQEQLSEDEFNGKMNSIRLLREDAVQQYNVASNNFAGRLPLVRFLGEPPFIKSSSFGTYELFMPPGEIASSRAVNTIGSIINQGLWGDAQLHMFVSSRENTLPDMESATRALFKNWYRVKIHDAAFLNQVKNINLNTLVHSKLDEHAIDLIFDTIQTGLFAFTGIELYNKIDDILFYKFKTTIYQKGEYEPVQTILHYEFVRDKRSVTAWILFAAFILLLVSIGLYFLSNRINNPKPTSKINQILTPLLFWTIGVIAGIIVLSVTAQLRPGYQEYISYAFWWVPVLFILLVVSSVIIVRKTIIYIPWLIKKNTNNKTYSWNYAISSLGVTTVLSVGLIVYHGIVSVVYIITIAYVLGLSTYLIGSFLDTFTSKSIYSIVPVIFLVPVSGHIVSGDNLYSLLIIFVLALSFHILYLKSTKSSAVRESGTTLEPEAAKGIPVDLTDFSKRVSKPPFFISDEYNAVFETLNSNLFKGTKILCLTGIEGIGKTVTANEIVKKIIMGHGENNILLINGFAEENDKLKNPYSAIRIALQDFFEVNPFENPESQLNKVDKVLDGIFDKVIPFSGLLFPKTKSPNVVSTEDEFFYMITSTVAHLAEKHPVVFYLDDIQWLDESSSRLVIYMHTYFKENNHYPILYLYTSRPDSNTLGQFLENEIIELNPFSKDEYYRFLTSIFGLNGESATLITDWVGEKNIGKGNMFWVLQVLKILVNNQHIIKKGAYFSLTDEILAEAKLPIPNEYRLSIKEELKNLSEYKHIIGIASVLGLEFNAQFISKALSLDYLYCLESLHIIEEKSDLIYDIPEKDGYFAFHSSFTLETIRAEYGVIESAEPDCKLKQIVKQYNAMLATSCEKELESLSPLILANYFYAAGPGFSEKTVVKSIKASRYCIETFQYNQARKYVFMIGERLINITADDDLLLDIALLKIDITTKEGRHIEISDNECQEILNNNQSISVEQLSRFAKYYYHIQLFEKGLNISHRILEIASNPYEKATGLFWKGLCLNFDKLDEKVKLLKESVTILEPLTDTKTNRLKSQLYNSLGEFHTRLAINEVKLKPVAVDCFNKSISIKKHPDTLDRAGMARSYGGLGRLELYVKPVNPAGAMEYFEKDLELSKITGDFKGQVKMHSLIGACQIQIGNFKEAVKNYSTSKEMSTTSIDTFFALLGLLEISVKAPEIIESDDITSEMLKLYKERSLPDFCLHELAKLIKQYPNNEALSSLKTIIFPNQSS